MVLGDAAIRQRGVRAGGGALRDILRWVISCLTESCRQRLSEWLGCVPAERTISQQRRGLLWRTTELIHDNKVLFYQVVSRTTQVGQVARMGTETWLSSTKIKGETCYR